MTIAYGSKVLISDFLNLTFFPKGTVLMYHGAWTDNKTIPGWYSCSSPLSNMTNMMNRFIRGASGNSSGGTGGSNNITVSSVPKHTHPVGKMQLAASSGEHTHKIRTYMLPITHKDFKAKDNNNPYNDDTGALGPDATTRNRILTISEFADEGQRNHTHKITVSVGTTGSGSGTTVDITPSYYNLIFIIKKD
jgi:hypothetical protein